MWSGRQTLERIEGAVAKLHRDETALDQALTSATSDAERLRRQRGDAFRELARIKLDEIMAGRLVRNLDAAETHAVRILENRRLRLVNVNEQRQTAIAELEQAEAARNAAGVKLEAALAAVEEVRVAAEKKVRPTTIWIEAQKSFEAADAIASGAEKKSASSEAELGAKKRPYDGDRLFTYLFSRGFGTSRYSAGNLVRMVDRWMADFIGFSEARANYAMLIEIPLRLKEHAAAQRKKADDRKAEVAAIERKAMVEEGAIEKERVLAEARHRLAAAYDTVNKKRELLRLLDQQRASLVEGTGDKTYADALQTIAYADAQDDIETLFREAKRTGTPSDDSMVRRIETIEEQLRSLDKEVTRLRASAQELAQRRVEVEQVRDRFRRSGYDHPNATFRNDNEIGTVLAQILEGVVRSGILWDLLRAGFGTRPHRGRPDFGAPDFPFPFPMPGGGRRGARGGEWRQPGTRGGWSPPDDFPSMPDSGGWDSRGSDDDFTTGGSF